jgi:hypothetical protein
VDLPPLIARSIGTSSLAFAGTAFPPAFADLLLLGISTSLKFDPGPEAYNVMRTRDTTCRGSFRLLFQSVNGFKRARRHAFVTAQSPNDVVLSTRPHRI